MRVQLPWDARDVIPSTLVLERVDGASWTVVGPSGGYSPEAEADDTAWMLRFYGSLVGVLAGLAVVFVALATREHREREAANARMRSTQYAYADL